MLPSVSQAIKLASDCCELHVRKVHFTFFARLDARHFLLLFAFFASPSVALGG